MKNILVLMVVFGSFIVRAQNEVIIKKGESISKFEKGTYYISEEMKERSKPFEGTWIYMDKAKTFTITIKTEKTFLKGPDIYMDLLQLKYCYRLNQVNLNWNLIKYNVGNILSDNINKAIFEMFYDYTKDKYGILSLELLSNGSLQWKIINKETIVINGDDGRGGKTLDRSFSMPTDIILTKQKPGKSAD